MKLFSMFKSRDKPKNTLSSTLQFFLGRTSSGQNVNAKTALATTAVYACVRVLSEAIASLPLGVYKYVGNGKERDFRHNLYRLLHDEPNGEMTSFVFRETLMGHLLLYGNAYAQIIRNGNGKVSAIYPLLPNKIDVSRNQNGEIIYTYSTDKGQVILRKQDILHIPGLGFDGLVGYSPIALAKNAIGMSISAEEYGATFFANGANPGGVLECPGVIKEPQKIRDSWNALYQGTSNAHRVAVLEEGLSFKSIGIPPNEAQFLETRKFQIEEIARIFRIPLHLIGDLEHATFSNIEHSSLEFVKYTLAPWVARWEQSLNQSLLLPYEKETTVIQYNLDGLMRGDYQSRMQGYATGIQNGFLSPNDVRILENLNPIDDESADKYYFNGNMIPVTMSGQQYVKTTNIEERGVKQNE